VDDAQERLVRGDVLREVGQGDARAARREPAGERFGEALRLRLLGNERLLELGETCVRRVQFGEQLLELAFEFGDALRLRRGIGGRGRRGRRGGF
jgi:hypothetical protein